MLVSAEEFLLGQRYTYLYLIVTSTNAYDFAFLCVSSKLGKRLCLCYLSPKPPYIFIFFLHQILPFYWLCACASFATRQGTLLLSISLLS